MRRILIGVAALGTWTAPCAALDSAEIVRLSGGVLKVEVLGEQGGYSIGSGVVVADQRVVTNCHVTRQARSVAVARGAVRWPAQAQAADVRHDLCVLRVDGLQADAPVHGRAAGLHAGQALLAVGYTGGVGLHVSDGTVVALHPFDGAPVIQATNRFTSGASGGALFDDRMRLVGILTFRMRGGDAHYFAAPIEWVERQLLAPAGFEPIHPMRTAELPYWQLPPQAQPGFLQAIARMRAARPAGPGPDPSRSNETTSTER